MNRRSILLAGIIIGLLGLILSGCVYRPDVQQGNIITNSQVKSLRHGMRIRQVRSLLGDPLLVNVYRDNRIVYVYTFQHNHDRMQIKRLIIYLKNGVVADYWYDDNTPYSPIRLPHP